MILLEFKKINGVPMLYEIEQKCHVKMYPLVITMPGD